MDTILSSILSVLKARGGDGRDLVDELVNIQTPNPNHQEMGEDFARLVGYNPITYHNDALMTEILAKAESLVEAYPTAQKMLIDAADKIKDTALQDLEDSREDFVYDKISNRIRENLEKSRAIPAREIDAQMDELSSICSGHANGYGSFDDDRDDSDFEYEEDEGDDFPDDPADY